ncbi:MAG TPA: hypothetical protein VIX61_03795 [Casimicrobiaceae bacterium]
MKIKPILAFAAAMAFSFSAHAHDCSGGAGGGMDATGNQCNAEGAYSVELVSHAPAANPAAQFGLRHEQNVVAGAIRPVATSANGAAPARSASQRAPKKHSHRAPKKLQATAG